MELHTEEQGPVDAPDLACPDAALEKEALVRLLLTFRYPFSILFRNYDFSWMALIRAALFILLRP